MNEKSDRESCDIVFCPFCNEDARLPESDEGFAGCIKCGGFGFVIKRKRHPRKRQASKRARKIVPALY